MRSGESFAVLDAGKRANNLKPALSRAQSMSAAAAAQTAQSMLEDNNSNNSQDLGRGGFGEGPGRKSFGGSKETTAEDGELLKALSRLQSGAMSRSVSAAWKPGSSIPPYKEDEDEEEEQMPGCGQSASALSNSLPPLPTRQVGSGCGIRALDC